MSLKVSKQDLHIKILRCVLDNDGPMSIPQIAKKLGLSEEDLRWVNEEADTGGKIFWRNGRDEHGNWYMNLSMTGRQILLDYEKLEDARNSSLRSTYLAIAAIVIAIILAFV